MQATSSNRQRQLLCVTTSKPSFAMAGGGGALTMVCPHTGSISSSLAVSGDISSTSSNAGSAQQQLGMSSLSVFPTSLSNALSPTPLALAFGGKGGAARDTAALLVSLNPSNPKAHWKARLPEANLTAGIHLSKCGHYAIGGGSSGTLYVWATLAGGQLLKSIPKAHYRAITCICLSQDARHVLTGGADGMVHLFSLLDLVSASTPTTNNNVGSKTVTPIRTWSQHAVPITALACLSQDRMLSASQDGVLLVLETFSEKIVAKIQLPQGISSLAVRHQRVWVGGTLGTLFGLDLDEYALYQTIQLGARIAGNDNSKDSPSYQTTLKGHNPHPITSLAVWGDDQGQEFLASGDALGTVRIWDLAARVCLRMVRPWSSTGAEAAGKKKKAASAQHPISSLHVLNVPEHTGATLMSSGNKKGTAWISRIPPLQKYSTSLDDESSRDRIRWTPVPLWNNSTGDTAFWDVTQANYSSRKRPRGAKTATAPTESANKKDKDAEDKDEELKRLRQQLEEANSTIAKWQKANSELETKLKQKT